MQAQGADGRLVNPIPASAPALPARASAEFARAMEQGQAARPAPAIPEAHTVRTGDNLYRIVRDALRAQGRPAGAPEIHAGIQAVAQANGLRNPDLIHPGQRLDLAALANPARPAEIAVAGPTLTFDRLPAAPPEPPKPIANFQTARASALAAAPGLSPAAALGAMIQSPGNARDHAADSRPEEAPLRESLRGRVVAGRRAPLAPELQSRVSLANPAALRAEAPPLRPSAAPSEGTGQGGPAPARIASVRHAAERLRGWAGELRRDDPAPAAASPWAGTLGAPGRLTSEFGMRRDPYTGRRAFHSGIDLAAPRGTPIHPFRPGVVTFSGWQTGYGRIVVVRHDNGVESAYAHNAENLVRVGDRVDRNTVIGKVGATGRATGPHLHFEIRKNGRPVNPMPFLTQVSEQLARGG